MPSQTPIAPPPTRESYIASLIPVTPTSADSPCPICATQYNTATQQPVLLRPCGHIFCLECILAWFAGGKNTCPLDRGVLFRFPAHSTSRARHYDADEWWEQLPFGGGGGDGISVETQGVLRRIAGEQVYTSHIRDSPRYIILENEIIGVNNSITRRGCRRFVRDLFIATADLFQRIVRREDGAVEIVASIQFVRSVVPEGIEVPDRAWAALRCVAKNMLRWQWEAWLEGWVEEKLGEAEVRDIVEEIWEDVCGDEERVLGVVVSLDG